MSKDESERIINVRTLLSGLVLQNTQNFLITILSNSLRQISYLRNY